MKKLLFSLLAFCACIPSYADGQITSNPSPAVSNKPLEVTITGANLGSEVYCYTWCKEIRGQEKEPQWSWDGVHNDKFRMTGSNGTYKFTITNSQEFYGLTAQELEGLTKLGFIAKNAGGGQTDDLFVSVVQGRRDAYSGGEGTATDPFIIATAADLKELSETPSDWAAGVYLKLDADIDAASLTTTIGTMASPFSANFDGNGHAISNLRLSETQIGSAAGLFGAIKGGQVKDLGVLNATVSGATYVGLLVGYLESGSVERCFAAGTVSGTSICVGGLAGENLSGTITDCYASADVTNEDDYATGGLVGKNRGTVSNTYAAGTIAGHDYVGGVVGANYGTIRNSVALNETITSYNDYAARFGGNNNERNDATANYSWNGIASGRDLWTEHGHHAGLKEAKELNNHEQFETLTGWDFDNVWEWRTQNNREYPALRAISRQNNPLSDAFYQAVTGIYAVSIADKTILVGPNPTDGLLGIRSANGISAYSLYSLGGSLVATGAPQATDATVDMTACPAGLYILRVADADGTESTFKVIRK